MILSKSFKSFFSSEKSGGLILLIVTVLSLLLANSPWQTIYTEFWQTNLLGHSLTLWINDGLMAIFFLLIGLELEREIYEGELKNIRNASLPIFGAIGGMIVPILIYSIFNLKTDFQSGAAIPMATDIAFAIGILSILGKRVPASLKVFLAALAVIDDLGAIIVIAVFYTSTISFIHLAIALGIYIILIVLNRLKVYSLLPYLIGGIIMWYFMLNSGIHPTITGVLLAFAIPFSNRTDRRKPSPSNVVEHFLQKPVAFFILPLFAIANTGIIIHNSWQDNLLHSASIGVILGLLIGKPLGITFFSYLSAKLKLSFLPKGIRLSSLIGAGFLGGIGFTMSIFITLLSFSDPDTINNTKMAILIGSLLSGVTGFVWLKFSLKHK